MNDDILPAFLTFRERAKSGLRRILEIERKQPHYPALLLIVTTCEVLSTLRYGRKAKSRVFVDELIGKHERITKPMAEDLWSALRNGVAHHFVSKYIEIMPGRRIQIHLNWGRGLPHLAVIRAPDRLNLNLPQMKDDLERILDRHRDHWQTLAVEKRKYPAWWRQELVCKAREASRSGWANLLEAEA